MTAITETAPQDTDTWIETNEHLARNMFDGLHVLANTILAEPDVAPLVAWMLQNLHLPVNALRDPDAAMGALAIAARRHGAVTSDADHGGQVGVNLDFSRTVRVWVMTDAPQAPESSVVEAAPEAHDEVPDDEPEAEPQDDADPLAETATFDTATEVTTS